MPRTVPTTTWTRNRYTFGITDVNGNLIADINNDIIMGMTDTNPLTTSWN